MERVAITIAGTRHLTGAPSEYTSPTNAVLHCVSMLVAEYNLAGGNLQTFQITVGNDGERGTVVALHGTKR